MSDDKPKVDHDYPPFSRVFVVCARSHSEEELRSVFKEYGEVEDIWLVKDKVTKENKGIAYIKYSKASEAAAAMEQLHGTTIGDSPKPIKALLADSRGSVKADPVANLAKTDDRHRTRLFILCSKSATESDLNDEFSQFGNVSHVQMLTDKATGTSKGCAYIRFHKPSEAFNALENCDTTYKAVMAEPRVPKNIMPNVKENQASGPMYSQIICPVPQGYPNLTEPGATNRLTITCHTGLTEHHLTRLCDVCPGLLSLQLATTRNGESRGMAVVDYNSPAAASYARAKLHNVEYPPGFRLEINYKQEHTMMQQGYPGGMASDQGYNNQGGYNMYENSSAGNGMQGGYNNDFNTGYQASNTGYQASNTGYQASNTGYQASTAPAINISCPYTDVALPGVQPLSTSPKHKAKLFFVAAPQPIAEEVLSDVFSRFNNLISIQIIPGTAYGYIKYAMKESADAAKMLLDGATVAGSTLRLSFAEEPDTNKRAKVSQMDH